MQWWMILIIVVAVLVLYVISTYNRLVKARNKVRDQWAQIDVQLKRRYDLIPNLVETVKGYAKHEKETLEAVINARNSAVSASSVDDKIDADNQVTQAISKLFALTESYPELKANENFIKLQDELSGIEKEVAGARQYYNAAVRSYNYNVMAIPDSIVASIMHHEKMKMFEANEEERKNVTVNFDE